MYKPDLTIMKSDKYRIPSEGLGLTRHILKEFQGRDVTYHIPNLKAEFDKIYKTTRMIKVPVTESQFNKEVLFWFSFEFDSDKSKKNVFGSVNSLHVPRGIHVDEIDWGIRVAIQKMFNLDDMYIPYLSGGIKLSVIAMINEVGYSSQTKERLSEIDGWNNDVKNTLHKAIHKEIRSDRDLFEDHVAQVESYVESLNHLKDINAIKSKIVIANSSRNLAKLPYKLKDASSSNRSECELFLLEGQSASGTLRTIRNSKIHGYLPMKGKGLNAVHYDTSDMLQNEVLSDVFNSIGAGVTGYNDISACRYGKIIIVSDEDSDGCVQGDVRVSLLDGTEVPIEELVGREEFYVYSCTPEGHIVPGRAHSCRVTKHVDEIYEVELDNGEVIQVTGNHPFMLRDGSYKRVDELEVGQSLMPLYRWIDEGKYNTGREYVKHNDTGQSEPTHWMVAGRPEKGRVIHHKDENPRNNTPSNLEDMSRFDHMSHHGKSGHFVKVYNGSQEQKEMLSEAHKRGIYDQTRFQKGRILSEYEKQCVSNRNKRMWDSTDPFITLKEFMDKYPDWDFSEFTEDRTFTYSEYMRTCMSKRQRKSPKGYDHNPLVFGKISKIVMKLISDGKEVNEENYNSMRSGGTIPTWKNAISGKYHNVTTVEELIEACKTYNHKVVRITKVELDEPIPVYDITVDEYHNFALSAGVFVHNSHIQNLLLGALAVHGKHLIEDGRVYVCETPFYKQNGKYFYKSDGVLPDFSKPVKRFKGIGSLSPQDATYSIVDKDTRRLTQVTTENIQSAINLARSGELKKKLMIDNGILK